MGRNWGGVCSKNHEFIWMIIDICFEILTNVYKMVIGHIGKCTQQKT